MVYTMGGLVWELKGFWLVGIVRVIYEFIKNAILNAQLEKLDLSPEKIEEIYDRLDAMNIQVVSSDLDLEVDSDLDGLDLMDGLGDEVDLSGIPEEDLVDPVDLADLAGTAFILDMDTKFLCSEDCKGLCPGCGADLNRESCRCKKAVDPRLAKLAQLLQKDE